jgi:glycosyltransferase involved in cell wall biosynthesis
LWFKKANLEVDSPLSLLSVRPSGELEIIVGVDGPDPETNIDGPRLRVSVNPSSLTAAAARNARMHHANGEWIAFLDDDDEWLPKKLAKQMAYAADRGPVLVPAAWLRPRCHSFVGK